MFLCVTLFESYQADASNPFECNQNRTLVTGKSQNVTVHPYRHSGESRNSVKQYPFRMDSDFRRNDEEELDSG